MTELPLVTVLNNHSSLRHSNHYFEKRTGEEGKLFKIYDWYEGRGAISLPGNYLFFVLV